MDTHTRTDTHPHTHTGTQMVSGGINKCRVGPLGSGVTAAYAAYFRAHGEKLSNCRTRPKKVSWVRNLLTRFPAVPQVLSSLQRNPTPTRRVPGDRLRSA